MLPQGSKIHKAFIFTNCFSNSSVKRYDFKLPKISIDLSPLFIHNNYYGCKLFFKKNHDNKRTGSATVVLIISR